MDSRPWRTAFLTLRDETLHLSDSPKPIGELLERLIFSQSDSLVSASPLLLHHELTSDLLFLLELAATSRWAPPEFPPVFSHITRLMHDICRGQRVSLQLNSSSWARILRSFASMLQLFLKKPVGTPFVSLDSEAFRPAMNCLELVRHLASSHKDKFSEADDVHLGMFLLQIIECSHDLLLGNSFSDQKSSATIRKGLAKKYTLFEFQTLAYAMLGEATNRLGASLPADFWHSAIKVLRKVLDALLSGSLLSDDRTMSRFYVAVLDCLHMVLAHPKGSLADHVSGFVATLRMFFLYGLGNKRQTNGWKEKEPVAINHNLAIEEPERKNQAPYKPPHLRKRENLNNNWAEVLDSSTFSGIEYSALVSTSSDSDCSDNDGTLKDVDEIQYSKVRVCAIVCIQNLCQADPKAFTGQWVMLLPTNDVLNSRKFEATLMTCLLFDPYMKTRIASASVLAVMLDRPSSAFLQIAEYDESAKWGSFMPLASSLGCILMQLHTGILHLILRERHSRLLTSLFKILVLLISSTPYARMPVELLPTVITSISAKIENEATFRGDQTCQTGSIISCLAAALSVSPPSPQVKRMLLKEISTADTTENEKTTAVLSTLFRYSEQVTNPAPCSEALQALRAMAHNYPSIVTGRWEQISCMLSKVLALPSPETTSRTWKNQSDNGFIGEKIITGAIKVLDESMRALCGFKGIEDLTEDKLFETPSFTSECTRTKKVSSAPSFGQGNEEDTEGEPHSLTSVNECWSQTIENILPQFLRNPSGMVRTALFTCFAGITSSAFFSLTKEKQEVIISALIDAAVHDKVPSVRSAACRAIGVISCFQQFPESTEIFGKMLNAIEINTRDPLGSVRIIGSWALANICNSLHRYVDNITLKEHRDLNASAEFTALLAECALRLTKDGDKVKSNAVRALGNLSRFVKYQGSSDVHDKLMGSLVLSCDQTLLDVPCLMERIVQAFLSCVTSGNVRVQWNACHAISNLFLNETLRLQDMDWAPSVFSILLLLLRDSSNFKIKIQAASALAVPATVIEYGKSFSDVVQVVVHILENLSSIQISEPSSFKYRVALEKQMTFTVLHVLALASSADHETVKDFLVKKAVFLEDWFKALSLSLEEPSNTAEGSSNPADKQKRRVISKALRSLVEVYEKKRHYGVAQKFEKLDESMIQ